MKSEIYYMYYICTIYIIHWKKLQFNQVIIIMEENMIMIKDPKIVCFNFYLPKDVDQNL